MAKPKPPTPKSGKRIKARTAPQVTSNDLHPIFCLRYLVSEFRVSDCEKEDQAAFAKRLELLSQLFWGQIASSSRLGVGTETIDHASLRVPIPPHITPDQKFLSLHLRGPFRVIGYRDNQVFHIVWIDPKHKVYPG